jgi:hypothetical protein
MQDHGSLAFTVIHSFDPCLDDTAIQPTPTTSAVLGQPPRTQPSLMFRGMAPTMRGILGDLKHRHIDGSCTRLMLSTSLCRRLRRLMPNVTTRECE